MFRFGLIWKQEFTVNWKKKILFTTLNMKSSEKMSKLDFTRILILRQSHFEIIEI